MADDEPRPASDPSPVPDHVPDQAPAAPVPDPNPVDGTAASSTPPPYDPYAVPPPPYDPYAPPPPYYWQPPKPGTNGFAVTALVVGIVGLCFCFGFLGIIFGNIARRQIEETGQAGAGMATAGIVLGWIAVAWIVLRILLVFGVGATSDF
ncbi:DUF4190 domain-containing protein [Glycomyces luteolus]|uniref:DUF4190 domain-containing protein n=1 Tax=Glycomyces luteolus TaxID=2670330 RepID=A0A9X3P729_9ACTN|nr:DUF4190 domain-containing protein [Glycomyces luteolus]MDA1359871.1 DUF4190 domain-containing protein [Glycomyces luteolus]